MAIVLTILAGWLAVSIAFGAIAAWGMFRFKRNTSRNPRPHQLIRPSENWKEAA
jgi:hypothetical protein